MVQMQFKLKRQEIVCQVGMFDHHALGIARGS